MSSWTRYEPIFKDWSKSGALLLRDEDNAPPLLFWGDSSITLAVGDMSALHY